MRGSPRAQRALTVGPTCDSRDRATSRAWLDRSRSPRSEGAGRGWHGARTRPPGRPASSRFRCRVLPWSTGAGLSSDRGPHPRQQGTRELAGTCGPSRPKDRARGRGEAQGCRSVPEQAGTRNPRRNRPCGGRIGLGRESAHPALGAVWGQSSAPARGREAFQPPKKHRIVAREICTVREPGHVTPFRSRARGVRALTRSLARWWQVQGSPSHPTLSLSLYTFGERHEEPEA